MKPSISVTLEPGLERGVPWGCDLYTFVTSAAGHMMRTLQKPRRNRPSKRQVNHRRFLHNMIQRKFADIEAANHRLASVLYLNEEGKKQSSQSPQELETLDQSDSSSRSGYLHNPGKSSVHTASDSILKSRSDVLTDSQETAISEKKQPELGHLWKQHLKPQTTTSTMRKNNQSKTGHKKESGAHKLVEYTSMISATDCDQGTQCNTTEYYNNESQLNSDNNPLEDAQITQQDSGFHQFGHTVDISPIFSPEICPSSRDSCDFSIQMFKDISTCTQAQKNITDISESQWTDIMDLFSVGDKNPGGYMDVETYFESFCAFQGDAGQEVCTDGFGFAGLSDSFIEDMCRSRSEGEYPHCETDKHIYEGGYGCQSVQGLAPDLAQSVLRQDEDAAEAHFDNFNIQNQLSTLISYQHDISELQMYQHPRGEGEPSPHVLVNHQNFTPFEGVAQSFTVPLHDVKHRPIPTPPHEDDWMFTDILKDRTSLDC